ncbi:MAG: hypothetical protein GKR88_17230 [Flavobacteriaceae bacterium]|nr:MAG: hypothetical protein GKR88_17230 [Flavobacteriaceae bacterium]
MAINESEAQTEKVLDYMAKKASKMITDESESKAIQELQNMVHLLEAYPVQNSYRLHLPKSTQGRRRLTQMLHDFIAQITVLHQYQRKAEQVLITALDDVKIAVDLMFESIVLKTDELDGILRQFYERLKESITKKAAKQDKMPVEIEFTQREIRQEFSISKTQTFRYFTELQELEYIQKSTTKSRNTFVYKIVYLDNQEKLRQEIRENLYNQIDNYRKNQKNA